MNFVEFTLPNGVRLAINLEHVCDVHDRGDSGTGISLVNHTSEDHPLFVSEAYEEVLAKLRNPQSEPERPAIDATRVLSVWSFQSDRPGHSKRIVLEIAKREGWEEAYFGWCQEEDCCYASSRLVEVRSRGVVQVHYVDAVSATRDVLGLDKEEFA